MQNFQFHILKATHCTTQSQKQIHKLQTNHPFSHLCVQIITQTGPVTSKRNDFGIFQWIPKTPQHEIISVFIFFNVIADILQAHTHL
jgi:hypothetical protein